MAKRRHRNGQRGLVTTGGKMVATSRAVRKMSSEDKRSLISRVGRLQAPVRGFVQEIFEQARTARGRLDDDVYGVLQATLEALRDSGGMPAPIVFGVSHFETGKVEQVGFMPNGVTELPPGGKFATNHPGFLAADVKNLSKPDTDPRRLEE
jgi:hypothetical protein